MGRRNTPHNKIMAQTKEEKAAYQKAWYKSNSEKVKAQNKARYEANSENIKAQKKAYYEANTEKINAKNKAHYEKQSKLNRVKSFFQMMAGAEALTQINKSK